MKTRISRFPYAGVSILIALASWLPGPLWAAVIGDSLQQTLDRSDPLDTVEVIVSYDQSGPLTFDQVSALDSVVLGGLFFQELPIAGAVVTAERVDEIAELPGVHSVWLNEELEYDNDRSTAITGVDRLRTDANLRTPEGFPYSGEGVGVVVNDSGVDGNHPDLPYPEKVVQNVAAQTNLNSTSGMLPVTYQEDVPDTDILGGHGTHVA
ncbi:MAG: hypothetical protein ACOCSR_05715, partial [Wenzhouxiangella sp.]